MRLTILYIPILIAVVLPFVFRRAYFARILSAIILCIVAGFHFTHLLAVHRLVQEDGVRHYRSFPLPADFQVAVDSIQKLSQREMWPFAVLIGALVLLALIPFKASTVRD